MMHDARVVAFVHAKGQSSRVPGKNLRVLGDRPLFCHAIANALAAKQVDCVVIDSDSDEILACGATYGAVALKRPAALANNAATGDDLALWQAQQATGAELVLQVVPTSPFLLPSSIDQAITLLDQLPALNSVVGVFGEALYTWEQGKPTYFRADGSIPNSFELEPVVYETTGLYANRRSAVLASGKRLDTRACQALSLSRIESVDINTPEDFAFAELLWYGLRAKTCATCC